MGISKENMRRLVELSKLNWDSPEDINVKWFGNEHDSLCEILEILYPDCDIDKLAFLFHCYDYLENQIQSFLDADGYSYDKSKWILKQYFESLVGGIPDELGDDKLDSLYITRQWNQPEFGATNEWLDFVNTAADIYRNGYTEKNMVAIARMRRLRQEFMDHRKD